MRKTSRGRVRIRAGLIVAAVAALFVVGSTDFRSPPRFDGAGYSVLGLSLATGRGYRGIDHPDAPVHAHFPPGYPATLATLWTITGRSDLAAHALSVAATIAATWLGWRWFRRVETRRVADLLGLALAANWTWASLGGSIQSEPVYLALSGLATLIAARVASGRGGTRAAIGLGLLLGSCVLTRHVGACLVLAVLIDLGSRRRWRTAAIVAGVASVVVLPWGLWLATVDRETQAGLLDAVGLGPRVAGQALFYARRVPDALSGPFVEVATVFTRSGWVGSAATAGAIAASIVVGIGLVRATLDPRRRLAGLVPLATLPLLLIWPFTEAGRFLIPLVPSLLIGAVEGLAWLGGLVTKWHPKGLRRTAAWAVLIAAIPYASYALATGRAAAGRRTHADFDLACRWIAEEGTVPGPILTRHPGEVFWLTGRLAVAPGSSDLDAIDRLGTDRGVAYLLVDPDRYADAPPTPLDRLAASRPDRYRLVRPGPVRVYERAR